MNRIIIPLILTALAGLSTMIGSVISVFIKKQRKTWLHFSLGMSAGVMIYVSFAELLPESVEHIGFKNANIAFFAGMLIIMLIDYLIPHDYIGEKCRVRDKDKKIMCAGVFCAVGIAIHNFPEGIAVFMSTLSDTSLGIALAFAIAMHNIPEGIAISMPIYHATESRAKALYFSLIAGIAEPIGALIAIILLSKFLNHTILSYILAAVAGIMVFISFDELLPLTYKCKKNHIAISGIIIGMVIMAVSLSII